MPKWKLACVIAAIASLIASRSPSQPPRLAFRASARDVSFATVQFDVDGATPLSMDVYRRPPTRDPRGALVFFNRGTGADRRRRSTPRGRVPLLHTIWLALFRIFETAIRSAISSL